MLFSASEVASHCIYRAAGIYRSVYINHRDSVADFIAMEYSCEFFTLPSEIPLTDRERQLLLKQRKRKQRLFPDWRWDTRIRKSRIHRALSATPPQCAADTATSCSMKLLIVGYQFSWASARRHHVKVTDSVELFGLGARHFCPNEVRGWISYRTRQPGLARRWEFTINYSRESLMRNEF